MKRIALLMLAVLAYPTVPGTQIRDYSLPGWKVEGRDVYPTVPGTDIRDYSLPGYHIEGKDKDHNDREVEE